MSISKRMITKVALSLGVIAIGLFLFLYLTGADVEPNICTPDCNCDCDEAGLFASLPNTGKLTEGAKSDSIASVITLDNTPIAFWKGPGTSDSIHYSYYNGTAWSNPIRTTVESGWGVNAILLEDSDPSNKVACLFVKIDSGGYYADERNGAFGYTCTTLTVADGVPVFGQWPDAQQTGLLLPFLDQDNEPAYALDNMESIVSSKPVPNNPSAFYLIGADEFIDRQCNPKATESERLLTCNDHQYLELLQGNYNFTNNTITWSLEGSRMGKYRAPAVVTTPEEPFMFFRHVSNENRISYADPLDENSPVTVLKNGNKDQRSTQERVDAYFFGDFLYVAYRNDNNYGIRFSRIPKDLWDITKDEMHGFEYWTHCQSEKEKGVFLAESTEGPSFFEYGDGLYFLYSDKKDSDILAYIRIDNLNINSSTCTGDW